MLTTIATVLAGLIGAGIIVIGVRAFWAPQAAVGFGIPGTPTEDRSFQAWLTVKAVRDIASGLFVFILVAGATPELLGWFMLAAAGIPVGDALIVWRSNGPKAIVFGVHGATAVVMLAVSVLLLVA
ncbi:DUF4267 domain-containing protein [Micromonospora sp. M51]|uniref:DUF4267 domain-containing protein n=1 Tax=Micromonospora parva TaxID=1464048 RepID=A0ABW6VNJ5_9ACTN|nr:MULTISPECIES: DUF4267 domain-containing protein [Micromonospora]MBQ1011886.1 DUF4267 domain-containing protein [Micromonospora sp. M51]MBQ1033326.1 DUF4267 domain-containing protein [Micromonospora sp. C97]